MKKPIPFGKYYLLERINVGGMAEVFRAKAYGVEGFERLVAVKRILPNIAEDKEFIKMFIDEAKIAVQLNHANVAQIFDLGMVDGSYYIALEHIHGRDVRSIFDRCRSQGEPMPIAQACFAVMKVCEGLDYAHNKRDQGGAELNLVHRDVSPQNVLISFEGEVKLIDFGIAKAAGKGSKTQAGILKGKFGYMSPEQVRGLPIDRRSDIFACGIVLYELLTGERLFVGESDFSTLEKVRNVEILPPSTYNRKIPDELERIALKALAKDVEDRYQNAIDLHDELQAFVYTAGEFYSRKDLAAWMKRMFHKEIEEETAKLEEYRRLRPPEQKPAVAPVAPPVEPEQRRRPTLNMRATGGAAVLSAPPPIPGANGNGSGAAHAHGGNGSGEQLEWDDEELETQIYDNIDAEPSAPPMAAAGHGGAASAYPSAGLGGELAAAPAAEPDLSSLIPSATNWDAPHVRSEPGAARHLASGSTQAPSPFVPAGKPLPSLPTPRRAETPNEPSAVSQLVHMAPPVYEAGYPDLHPGQRKRTVLWLLIGAVLIAAGTVGALLYVGSRDDSSIIATQAQPAFDLDSTGFDLYLEPEELSSDVTVKLDGKIQNTPPPVKIRQLTPGDHVVSIEAPAGYGSKTETITVAPGEAGRVTIRLTATQVSGRFDSEPTGGMVTVVRDGVRLPPQPTPADVPLDPAGTYEVIFEKSGFVSKHVPLVLSGNALETVTVTLERVARKLPLSKQSSLEPDAPEEQPAVAEPVAPQPEPEVEPTPAKPAPRKIAVAKKMGMLLLNSRPPCKIYVDGRDTGKTTPEKLKLAVGRHEITLLNNDHNIRESFPVTISDDAPTKLIKDLTDRMR